MVTHPFINRVQKGLTYIPITYNIGETKCLKFSIAANMRGHSVALQWTTGYIEIATSSGFNNFQSMCMHKTRRHFQTIVYQGGWYLFLTKLARLTTLLLAILLLYNRTPQYTG